MEVGKEKHLKKPRNKGILLYFKQEKTLEVPNKGYLEGFLNGDEENRTLFTIRL